MIKNEDFMKGIAELFDERGFGDLCALEPDVSDGSSYDGFVNFTDGFVDCKAEYVPFRDEPLVFKGFTEEQKKNAENAQKCHDCFMDEDDLLTSYYKDNRDDLSDKWNQDEFIEWWHRYIPEEGHWEQLDLFTGESCFTKTSDPKLDEIYFNTQEYIDCYYNDSPAFVGVSCRLYDEDNSHTGYKMCRLISYFNDDLSYGRECVGSWAGKSADGKPIGNHCVYEEEFDWNDYEDLISKLREKLPLAYETLGF